MSDEVGNGLARARSAIATNSRFVNALTYLLFPAVLSVWTGQATPEKVGTFWFYAVIVLIGAIQLLAFLFLNQAPSDDVPGMMFDYHDLRHRLADTEAHVNQLEQSLENTVAAQVIGRYWAASGSNLTLGARV